MRILLACLLLSGCAHTPPPVVLPPEVIRIPQYVPLPPECSKEAEVDLPVGSTAADVMAKQKKALDEQTAQIKRCFGSPSAKVL